MKHWFNKIIRYFLLLLFLGYYGSITLFTHTHIVNGVTIVHSHPFSHSTEKTPLKHQHTINGFLLIQILSNFSTTVLFFVFSIEVLKIIVRKYFLHKNKDNISINFFISSNGLRAPPLNIHN